MDGKLFTDGSEAFEVVMFFKNGELLITCAILHNAIYPSTREIPLTPT